MKRSKSILAVLVTLLTALALGMTLNVQARDQDRVKDRDPTMSYDHSMDQDRVKDRNPVQDFDRTKNFDQTRDHDQIHTPDRALDGTGRK